MKKLRFFDSLKLVLATVACMFILNVAHADTNAIQSVIAYGKTEQSGTPTPTAPVPIMTNNGVLKVSPNLFDALKAQLGDISTVTGEPQATTRRILSDFIPIKPNTKYTASGTFNIDGNNSVVNRFIYAYYDANKGYIENSRTATTTGTTTITTANNASYKYIRIVYFAATGTNASIANSRLRFEEGSTATTGVYVDGLTETIRDSAGHTATAQMLLGINNTYRDEQNINTGAITRKVGVKVLDGTEDWATSTTYGADVFIVNGFLPNSLRISANNGSILFSTHFAPAPMSGAPSNPKVNNTMSINSTYHAEGDVWIRSNNFSTVAQFKSWLAEQYANGMPVVVVYPLKASAQTTENVTTQQMTTAPVRQTAGSILGMPIEVVLGDGTREWVRDMITIATTRYNEEQFEPVQNRLSDAMDAVDDVVTRTMSQAQAIDQIANEKQTRPAEGCTAKYCLLVEDEDGTPHWYPIAGANGVAHALPAGYTELQYIESTGTQYIDTGVILGYNFTVSASAKIPDIKNAIQLFGNNVDSTKGFTCNVGNVSGVISRFSNVKYTGSFYKNSTDVHTYTVNKNGIKIDNDAIIAYDGTPNDFTQTDSFYLLAARTTTGASNIMPSGTQLYSAKVYDNNTLVLDLVPAKNSNNVVGMYDLADPNPSTAFYTNAGTGTFVAGPNM